MGFDINNVTVSGNLTRDPELRSLPSGISVCSLRIAHNSRRKDNNTGEWVDVPHYFDVTVWGGFGEWIAGHVGKGQKVVVSGQLKWREWTTDDGGKRQAVDINAYDVVPIERSGGQGGGGQGGGGFTPRSDVPVDDRDFQPATTTRPSAADDDIPF